MQEDAAYFLDAYMKLDTERRFSEGAIPYSAVRDYFGNDVADAWQIIHRVDVEFTEFLAEERKKKNLRDSKRGAKRGKKR